MKENKILVIIEIAIKFISSLFGSVLLFFRTLFGKGKGQPLKENRFLDILNFILHTGPKSFWKNPSGIRMGRSISTFLHYVFEKESHFKQSKKFDK